MPSVVGQQVHRNTRSLRLRGRLYLGVSLMHIKLPSRFILVFHDTNLYPGTNDSTFLCAVGDGKIPTRIEERSYLDLAVNYRTVSRWDVGHVLKVIPQMEDWLIKWVEYDRPTR